MESNGQDTNVDGLYRSCELKNRQNEGSPRSNSTLFFNFPLSSFKMVITFFGVVLIGQ